MKYFILIPLLALIGCGKVAQEKPNTITIDNIRISERAMMPGEWHRVTITYDYKLNEEAEPK